MKGIVGFFVLIFVIGSTYSKLIQKKLQTENSPKDVIRDYTTEPENTGCVTGRYTTFVCSSDTYEDITWLFREEVGGPYATIVSSCRINPVYTSRFGLANVTIGPCDLAVLSPTVKEATTYVCQAGFEPAVSAQLAVLDTEPQCFVTAPDPLTEGENVTLTCEVSYTTNISPIQMTWTDSSGQPVKSTNMVKRSDGNTVSSITITATNPGIPSFTCTVNFTDPSGLPSTATNTPQYTYVWNSPEIAIKGSLISPINVAVEIGQPVRFNCRRRSTDVNWLFSSGGTNYPIQIVSKCVPLGAVSHLFTTDTHDESCDLIISAASLNHGGVYTCQDMTVAESAVSAELTVLDISVCSTNITQGSLKYGTPVHYTCQVTYRGNLLPTILWTTASNEILSSAVTSNSTLIEFTVSFKTSYPLLKVSMLLYFEEPVLEHPPYIEPATNAPLYTDDFAFEMRNVTARDCDEIFRSSQSTMPGVYSIWIDELDEPTSVYCDNTTDGGGWTVFHRRIDGLLRFNKSWDEYTYGFGELEREFWLGNKYISAMTSQKQYLLRVDLQNRAGLFAYEDYTNFRVGGELTGFTLQAVGTASGTAGNSLSYSTNYHVNMKWTTYDRDNDFSTTSNCALTSRGAWWYYNCHYANLNGEYNNTAMYQGNSWYTFGGRSYSLKFSEMKIRPFNVTV